MLQSLATDLQRILGPLQRICNEQTGEPARTHTIWLPIRPVFTGLIVCVRAGSSCLNQSGRTVKIGLSKRFSAGLQLICSSQARSAYAHTVGEARCKP
jgi:hypothetical protein